jgi:hypothetical protein
MAVVGQFHAWAKSLLQMPLQPKDTLQHLKKKKPANEEVSSSEAVRGETLKLMK